MPAMHCATETYDGDDSWDDVNPIPENVEERAPPWAILGGNGGGSQDAVSQLFGEMFGEEKTQPDPNAGKVPHYTKYGDLIYVTPERDRELTQYEKDL
jgi:hypothetical protein